MQRVKPIYQRQNVMNEVKEPDNSYHDMYFSELVHLARNNSRLYTRVCFHINNNMDKEACEILESYRYNQMNKNGGE